MGIDMTVEGRYGQKGLLARPAPPERFLDSVKSFIDSQCKGMVAGSGTGVDGSGARVLAVALHPAEQPAEFRVPKAGHIVCDARTSNAGPGYHQFLSELLDRMAPALQIEWDRTKAASGDETGYFAHRDRSKLEGAMLAFLQALAKQVGSQDSSDLEALSIGLGIDHQYETGGRAATATGPRTADWFRAVAQDPRRGIEHFAWWHPGTGAHYHLGRALTLMWTEVRWRAPLSEEEQRLDHEVLTSLETAYRLDPSLSYPWREWIELARAAGHESPLNDELARRAQTSAEGEPISYRRRDVTAVILGGWTIRIPGSFAEIADEGGWHGFDGGRTVDFGTITVSRIDGLPESAEELLRRDAPIPGKVLERYEHRGEHVLGKATLLEVELPDEPKFLLSGAMAVPNTRAIITICFRDAAQKDWAVSTWRSVDVMRT